MLTNEENSLRVGKHQKPLTELELELSRVKRELAEVKMEHDFIKKCVTYFCQGVTVRYGLIESCDEAIRLHSCVEY